MNGMMIHCGGKLVTKDTLDLVPMPQETATYKPVSHYTLADKVITLGRDLLKGFSLEREQYAIAKDGKQFFGMLNFAGEHPDMGLCLAFRNSYDRSMAIGFAIGAQVFVCDNLALTGDITVMRKHTSNVWNDLESTLVTTIYNSRGNYVKLIDDSTRMIGMAIANEEAWQLMGLLYGMEILSPRQLTDVRDQWAKPDHKVFQARNLWSFYNDCTQALKSTPPIQFMDKHLALHRALMNYQQPEAAIPIAMEMHPCAVPSHFGTFPAANMPEAMGF